jgi:hypothetical protein
LVTTYINPITKKLFYFKNKTMKKLNNNMKVFSIAALVASICFLSSCNKELESFTPLPTPVYPAGNITGSQSIARTIAANKADTMFYIMLVRSGLLNQFNDSTKTLTLFAVDTTGMKIFVNAASGGAVPLNAPNATFYGFLSSSLPVATAAAIIQYNTLGQKYPFANFGGAFPNYPAPSSIQLDPVGTPFLRMTICPTNSTGIPFKYVNNIPAFGQFDLLASNGIIHHTYTVVAPPSQLMKAMIANEPTLTYFRAAVNRADSGSVGTNRLDSLMGFGALNMTVLTPNDAAMRPVLFGALYQGLYPIVYNTIYNTALAAGATTAQAIAAATAQAPAATVTQATSLSSTPAGFNVLPVATVKGIIAYHFIASNATGSYKPDQRVFSVNVPTTAGAFVKTLVNGSIAVHPGILARSYFSTLPVPDSVKFTGLGTFPGGGTAYSDPAAKVVKADNHAVNGVYHIIDRVLLPQ